MKHFLKNLNFLSCNVKNSKLKISNLIEKAHTKWDIEEIQKRQKKMGEIAVKVWKI